MAKTTDLFGDVVKAGVVRHELALVVKDRLVAYEAVVDAVGEPAVDAVVETAVVEAVVGLLAVDLVNSAHAVSCLSRRPPLL